MSSSTTLKRLRALGWALFAALIVVLLVDGGSVAITQARVGEDIKSSARQAVQAIHDQPVNVETAKLAYAAAVQAMPDQANTIVGNVEGTERDFTVHPDGSITMTVTRTAPTLLFKHLPKLRDLTAVEDTHTQAAFVG